MYVFYERNVIAMPLLCEKCRKRIRIKINLRTVCYCLSTSGLHWEFGDIFVVFANTMNNWHLACIVDFLRDADFYATKINLLPFIWKKNTWLPNSLPVRCSTASLY
jgi:hypothetical protein